MSILEGILSGISVFSPSGLFESMKQSKTLTVMVIVGVVSFSAFIFFLYKMAGAQ